MASKVPSTGWGYFYLAGAIDDERWKYSLVLHEAAYRPAFAGSVADFIQTHRTVFPSIALHLSNKVKRCPACGKSCGYTISHCNNCGGSIELQSVTRTDNALMGFVYGIGVSDCGTLGTSIRFQCDSFLVYDDIMQTTLIHLNSIPTGTYIPDFRFLLSQPKRGLALIMELFRKAKQAACKMLEQPQFVSKFYSANAVQKLAAEGVEHFVSSYVLSGFNYPPSQCQLHLQFILPPYVPYHAVLQAEGKHLDMNRFFPFDYVVRLLETLVASNACIPMVQIASMSGSELISFLDKTCDLDYCHFYHEAVIANRKNSDWCSNWVSDDFSYMVINKSEVVPLRSCTEPLLPKSPLALLELDRTVLQSYGRTANGNTQIQYYSYPKRPGEVRNWDETDLP